MTVKPRQGIGCPPPGADLAAAVGMTNSGMTNRIRHNSAPITRRTALTAIAQTTASGIVASALASTVAAAAPRTSRATTGPSLTASLQARIDAAAPLGQPVVLPPGTTVTRPLTLRTGTIVTGHGPSTRLLFTGGGPALIANDAHGLRIVNLTIDGNNRPLFAGQQGDTANALLSFTRCDGLALDSVTIANASGNGVNLAHCTGRIDRCTIAHILDAGLFALDSRLSITGNTVEACGNNGILIWRSAIAEDCSDITGNRIANIRADGGGTGQNGNGINVFRAGGVRVQNNTITDCAYTGVRANAASNVLISANTCLRLGEVALYAEHALDDPPNVDTSPGFQGAVISNNIVDRAATGISVTNFSAGGRLAVIQGNLIRNLFRRDREPVDQRGHGICVEADATVTGNTIEGAPTAGIVVGWGRHMRDVAITGNLVRASRSGVLISSDPAAQGRVLIANNIISSATDGAIRAHDHGRAFGPDLAREPASTGRVSVSGNVVG